MKTLTRLLLILALAGVILWPAAAKGDPSHYTYSVSDGQATITGYSGPGGNIAIPNTLGGYAVTSIGSTAFSNRISLTGVTIPDSVTSIGSFAFLACTSLASVTIPDSVASIGNSAFWGCTSVASVTIPHRPPLARKQVKRHGPLFARSRRMNPILFSHKGAKHTEQSSWCLRAFVRVLFFFYFQRKA